MTRQWADEGRLTRICAVFDMTVLLAEGNDDKMRHRGSGFLYRSDQIGTDAAMRVASVRVVGNSSQAMSIAKGP
jgi:hypothetical protein